jgi:hypothetical protein
VAGSCEHGNDHSDSIKDGEFIDHLNDHHLLRSLELGVLCTK